MRVQVDPQAAPRTLYWGERRTTIVEVIDQWHGPGYRYVKVKGYDSNVYILRFDQIRDTWDLIMFSSERAPRLFNGSGMTWLVQPSQARRKDSAELLCVNMVRPPPRWSLWPALSSLRNRIDKRKSNRN